MKITFPVVRLPHLVRRGPLGSMDGAVTALPRSTHEQVRTA